MLVPLTDSLYARGTLGNRETVLIDIGTGYFAEVRLYQMPSADSAIRVALFAGTLGIRADAFPPLTLCRPSRSTLRRPGRSTASGRSRSFRRA